MPGRAASIRMIRNAGNRCRRAFAKAGRFLLKLTAFLAGYRQSAFIKADPRRVPHLVW